MLSHFFQEFKTAISLLNNIEFTCRNYIGVSCSPIFLLNDYIDILIQPITSIVNLSLSEGVVIDKFKCAVMTPLIKKPFLDADEFKNFRPVLVLIFFLNQCNV